MDKVLKRRLIGASILIALAVIFLPMLLVGPEPDLDDRSVRQPLPDRPDAPREIRRIPLDPELARVPPDEEPEPAAPTPRPITLDPPSSSAVENRSMASSNDGDATTAARTEPPRRELPAEIVLNPDTEASQRPEPTPAAREPASRPETADPAPTPSVESPPVPAEAPGPSSGGRWVVQVASFGSLESSRATRERLEALGHPVVADEVVRGDTLLYRLRTGPYADASAAETARGQIAATVVGVQPLVREIEAGALEATPGFAVQVGSFASLENAERETERLRGLGFEAFRMSDDTSGRSIWKVLVGTVSSREQAEQLRARLTAEAGVEGLVVSHP